MNIFRKIFVVHLYLVILVCLGLAVLISGGIYLSSSNPSSQFATICAGLCTGFFVALIQFLFSLNEYRENSKIKELGVKQILPYRDEEKFYGELVTRSKMCIRIIGNTCSRFIEDFANAQRPDKQALLAALNRGVEVEILVPRPNFLPLNEQQKANSVAPRLIALANSYPNFKYRYFDHEPSHSLVWIDSECLVGPILPGQKSKNSPAIYLNSNSAFAAPYKRYFSDLWQQATP